MNANILHKRLNDLASVGCVMVRSRREVAAFLLQEYEGELPAELSSQLGRLARDGWRWWKESRSVVTFTRYPTPLGRRRNCIPVHIGYATIEMRCAHIQNQPAGQKEQKSGMRKCPGFAADDRGDCIHLAKSDAVHYYALCVNAPFVRVENPELIELVERTGGRKWRDD